MKNNRFGHGDWGRRNSWRFIEICRDNVDDRPLTMDGGSRQSATVVGLSSIVIHQTRSVATMSWLIAGCCSAVNRMTFDVLRMTNVCLRGRRCFGGRLLTVACTVTNIVKCFRRSWQTCGFVYTDYPLFIWPERRTMGAQPQRHLKEKIWIHKRKK